jgi:hypothetical protein
MVKFMLFNRFKSKRFKNNKLEKNTIKHKEDTAELRNSTKKVKSMKINNKKANSISQKYCQRIKLIDYLSIR